ncbi:MAG: histidine phosphatase family protein [Candidatus Nanosyncoccus sp.]|jgi:hypothetical protein
MKFYIVRHGQTDWNNLGLNQGWSDTPLNTLGQFQALKARDALRDVRFDIAYSSPLQRAAKTCQIILGRTIPDKSIFDNLDLEDAIELNHIYRRHNDLNANCYIYYMEDLIERGLGVFEGKEGSRIHEISWKDGFNADRFKMESVPHMFRRVDRVLKQIQIDALANYGGDAKILITSHAGILRIVDYILRGGTEQGLFYSALYDSAINLHLKNCEFKVYER